MPASKVKISHIACVGMIPTIFSTKISPNDLDMKVDEQILILIERNSSIQ